MQNIKLGIWSVLFVGSCFTSIYLTHKTLFNLENQVLFIAAFGAAVVLDLSIQSFVKTPAKIMFLGSLIGSVIGVLFSQLQMNLVLSSSVAIAICTGLMTVFNVKYPPGGAMVLIPILGGEEIQSMGFVFVLYPVLTGISIVFAFSRLQLVFIKNHLKNGKSGNN